MPIITLALVTHDQADYLEIFLKNYLQNNTCEIPLLIIDDGSSDATPHLLKNIPKSISVYTHAHAGIAIARNRALKHCLTPWIAFTDTDCILDQNYFQCLLQLPERFEKYPAVEGSVWPPHEAIPPLTHFVHNRQGGMYVTANMAFHIPTVLALGGFDEAFGNYREDIDLALTIKEQKGIIPFWSEWKVEHPYTPRPFRKTVCHVFTQQKKIVLTEIKLYSKHPESYTQTRFYKTARDTIKNWCLKHTLGIIKQRITYWKQASALSSFSLAIAWNIFWKSLASIGIAGYEQFCLILIYVQYRKALCQLPKK